MKTEIERILDVERAEVGYLEKASGKDLDSKTGNAGYSNHTKYWRDLTQEGLMTAFGYAPDSGFTGGTNWPYCAAGQCWSFLKALGKARMQELLLHKGCAFINCETMYNKAKEAKQLLSAPQPGALVLFKQSNGIHGHVEFCYSVSGGIFYTIGFNTSGASGVIANGGGVCEKRYVTASTAADYFMPKYADSTVAIKPEPGISVTRLKKGSSGAAVKEMQEKLLFLGYSLGSWGADGDFGSATFTALKNFQADHAITVDGIYGEESARELNKAYEAKKNANKGTEVKDPDTVPVLFVGEILQDNVDVRTWAGREYGNIKSWPKLGQGNLVDVMDYTQKDSNGENWYFVRIANQYKGFVNSKYIAKH